MNNEEFVDVVIQVVRDASVEGVLSGLEHPAGRKAHPELVTMSNWFNSLDALERQVVELVVKRVADQCVFGFLAVLDGVRPIENGTSKGRLELAYVREGKQSRLNDPNLEMLHDIFTRKR